MATVFAGVVRKRLKPKLGSTKVNDIRVYRIARETAVSHLSPVQTPVVLSHKRGFDRPADRASGYRVLVVVEAHEAGSLAPTIHALLANTQRCPIFFSPD